MGGANNAFCLERRDTFVMHSPQRRLEPVVILRNRHMTIAHSAIFVYAISA